MDAVNLIMMIIVFLIGFITLCLLLIWVYALLVTAWFTPSWAEFWTTHKDIMLDIKDDFTN